MQSLLVKNGKNELQLALSTNTVFFKQTDGWGNKLIAMNNRQIPVSCPLGRLKDEG